MQKNTHNIKQLELAYELIRYLDEDYLELVYRGHFTERITGDIVSLTNVRFLDKVAEASSKNKITYFIIESLQNVVRHQDVPSNKNISSEGLLIVQKTRSSLYISTANVIRNKKIPKLETYLKQIQVSTPDTLKKTYKKILFNGVISEKGGGGLGIVTMARRAGGHISYMFKKIDKECSYYYYQIRLDFNDIEVKDEIKSLTSLERIFTLHSLLNKDNILLNLNGLFDYKNFELLLPIIETYGETGLTQKVFDLTVGLIHNVIEFGDKCIPDDNASPGKVSRKGKGVYLLSSKGKTFYLTVGNIITNDKIPILKNKINVINGATATSLKKIKDYLQEFYYEDFSQKPDISLIDMRLNNNNRKIKYIFKKINQEISYFILQLEIPHIQE